MDEETPQHDPRDVWSELLNNTLLYGTAFLQMRRLEGDRMQVRIVPPEEYLEPGSFIKLDTKPGDAT